MRDFILLLIGDEARRSKINRDTNHMFHLIYIHTYKLHLTMTKLISSTHGSFIKIIVNADSKKSSQISKTEIMCNIFLYYKWN